MSLIRTFNRDTQGNIAMMFAVTAGMLAMGVAVATDYSGMERAKIQLQNQVDSAALGAAVRLSETKDKDKFDLDSVIKEFLISNGYNVAYGMPTSDYTDGVITVSAKIPYELAFGGIYGQKTKDIGATSEVGASGGQTAEIALVIDNTNSMNFEGRIGALRIAANELVDAIDEGGTDSKVAIVPFARYVNVGVEMRGESWLDVPMEYDTDRSWQQATHSGGTCHYEETTLIKDGYPYTYDRKVCVGQVTTYETQYKVVESRWEGCVGTRTAPDNASDGNYVRKIPGLLNTQPYEATGQKTDREAWCPAPISPLTDNYEKLKGDIAELFGTDNTYMPMGLMWGKRVLSSEAPYTEADTKAPMKQVMILMSDGMNFAKLDNSAEGQAEMHAPPYIADLDDNYDVAVDANKLTASLCEGIKQDGIEIYTVAFMITDPTSRNLLANCASSPSHSFVAGSNKGLVDSFVDISTRLESELRIIR